MSARLPRLVPEIPLPPYSYVPGGGLPHPISNPDGHSFGRRRPPAVPLDRRRWPENRPYLYGFDLLNRGFYWEAHEAWEPLWHASGRRGEAADLLKGLIKLAAAGVKHREARPRGTATHARRAAELWAGVALALALDEQADAAFGLRLRALIDLARSIAEDGWPAEPILLLPALPGA